MAESEAASDASKQQFRISPSLKIGYVSLNVSDVQASLDFYRSVLGFKVAGKPSDDRVLLSADGSGSGGLVELLRAKNAEPDGQKRAGLYHFAILLPERAHLADMLRHLGDNRDKVQFDGMADHLVSEAIYIRDPDFNGIEIYRDRPYSEWKWAGNNLQLATLGLDADDLLRESTGRGWKAMPHGTAVGHVHLHVSNLPEAMKFYNEILGLSLTTTYPGAYFFAAGKYHHHVAANTWLGSDVRPASSGHIGLNHFGIELPDKDEYERVTARLRQCKIEMQTRGQSGGAFVHDSDGITIRLYAR